MGFIVKAVKKVVKVTIGIVGNVIGKVFSVLVGGGKKSKAQSSNGRLNKSLNPEDFRKIIFGKTASALDLRYWEVYGTNGTQYDEVIAMASHTINAVKELYIENDLAINASNVVQTKFSGVLTRAFKLGTPGQTALSVGAGGQYTSAAKMTGVAHMVLKWTKNDTKLPNGPPSRYTNIIEGALVYDPRRDSTQPGGAGTHRINDQSTWAYATTDSNGVPIGRNNALQALWYLLGWRVQNPVTSEWVLVAGRGIDPNDINIQTFITGANNCEAAGFYTDMILSTEDEHTTNEDKITADGLIATLLDPGGLWSYYANVDDTASVAVYLTDDDVLDTGKVMWDEYKGMSDQFNQVVGKFIDPSSTALYQPRAYPMVRDSTYETNLGVKRRKPIDFEQIQDALLAQKLARLMLNQGQYQAEFSANFNYKALKAQAWSIVSYTSERYQWTKLFRVYRYAISGDSGTSMTLREVHPSIWTAGSVTTPVTAPLGSRYDPTQAITLAGLAATAYTGTDANGSIYDGLALSWTAPSAAVNRVEVQLKLTTDTAWQSFGPFTPDVVSCIMCPLLSGAVYNVRARSVSVHEVVGPWVNVAGNFTAGTNGNVNAGAIVATVALGNNSVTNSDWVDNDAGFYNVAIWGGGGSPGYIYGRDLAGYGGNPRHVLYGRISTYGTALPDSYFFGPGQKGFDGNVANLKLYGLPVVQGDTLCWGGRMAIHGGDHCSMRVRIFNASGTLVEEYDVGGVTGDYRHSGGGPSGIDGNPANFQLWQGTHDVTAATAAYAVIGSWMYTSSGPTHGDQDAYIFLTEPMLAKVAAGQTVLPPYTPGPALRNATSGAPAGTMVGSTAAATVESGANAANNGVNSDGTIKTDKVATDAAVVNAFNKSTMLTYTSANVDISSNLTYNLVYSTSFVKDRSDSVVSFEVLSDIQSLSGDMDFAITLEVRQGGVLLAQWWQQVQLDGGGGNLRYPVIFGWRTPAAIAAGTVDLYLYINKQGGATIRYYAGSTIRINEGKR